MCNDYSDPQSFPTTLLSVYAVSLYFGFMASTLRFWFGLISATPKRKVQTLFNFFTSTHLASHCVNLA